MQHSHASHWCFYLKLGDIATAVVGVGDIATTVVGVGDILTTAGIVF